MYNEYFGLDQTPFPLEPSAKFIVFTEDHREALATMVYAVEQQEGWAVLLGPPGIGKTTMIIALLQELSERIIPAVIVNPHLDPLDFMNMVALELGLDGPFQTKGAFMVAFKRMVIQCRGLGKVLLLVVDEAQAASFELLEELRLLANVDDGTPRVFNVLLVGQTSFLGTLARPDAEALRQRMRHYHTLRSLTVAETRGYISHRLGVAGGKPDLFTERGAGLVHTLTGGIPRLVNLLCDEAMIVAFTRNHRKVDYDDVREASGDLLALKRPAAAEPAPPLAEPVASHADLAAPEPVPAPRPEPEPERAPRARPEPKPEPRPEPKPEQERAPRARPEPRPATKPETVLEPEPAGPEDEFGVAESDLDAADWGDAAPGAAPRPQARPPRRDPEARATAAPAEERPRPSAARPKKKRGAKPAKAKAKGASAAQPSEKIKRPNFASRYFASMGKGVPGGFARRLIFLVVLLALFLGAYLMFDGGRVLRLGRLIAPYLGLAPEVELYIPGESAAAGNKAAMPELPPDWGPIITIGKGEGGNG